MELAGDNSCCDCGQTQGGKTKKVFNAWRGGEETTVWGKNTDTSLMTVNWREERMEMKSRVERSQETNTIMVTCVIEVREEEEVQGMVYER